MKYIEWRDELKGYLGDLPEDERQKVLAYFAEMYADKRDAGLKESEIISEFGAPYDVARRILNERYDEGDGDDFFGESYGAKEKSAKREKNKNKKREKNSDDKTTKCDNTWILVLLCIIFAVPLFSLIFAMTVITVCLCTAPLAALIGGISTVIGGIVALCAHGAGLITIGIGVIIIGAGCLLAPLFFGAVKFMWKAFRAVFAAIRRALG